MPGGRGGIEVGVVEVVGEAEVVVDIVVVVVAGGLEVKDVVEGEAIDVVVTEDMEEEVDTEKGRVRGFKIDDRVEGVRAGERIGRESVRTGDPSSRDEEEEMEAIGEGGVL